MKESAECKVCHSKVRVIFLHNLRVLGEYKQLCTSCVLKHHSGSFCPHCFEIYQGFIPPVDSVHCLECNFPSHLACVTKDVVSSYHCPSCLNPSHLSFDFKPPTTTTTTTASNQDRKIIDVKLSKKLLTAAQFASSTMKKRAAAEWTEANKKGKAACETRKVAKEALQNFQSTALRFKKDKESKMIQPIPSPVAVEEPIKKPKVINSAVAIALEAQKITNQNRLQKALIEGKNANVSSVVVVGGGGVHASRVVQRPFTNGAPVVGVGDNDKLKGSPTTVMDYPQFGNAAAVNGKEEKPLNISQLRINDVKAESEKNRLLSVSNKTEGLLQRPQIKEDPDEVKEFGDSRRFPPLIQSNEVGSADAFNSRNNKGSSKTVS